MTTGTVKHSSHGRRYYILLITIMVGILLVILLINDEGSLPLTGSAIGAEKGFEKGMEESEKGKNEIKFTLSFDNVPEIEETNTLGLLRLNFNELSTKIKVNEEELELKGLSDINMEIAGFEGKFNFDEEAISLDGEAERLLVNGIEISSKGKIKISFNSLAYNTLEALDAAINTVNSKEGSGSLVVGENKMSYNLAYEKVRAANFRGEVKVGLNNQSLMLMEGEAASLLVGGDFNLVVN